MIPSRRLLDSDLGALTTLYLSVPKTITSNRS
jgi:hypothetical protein